MLEADFATVCKVLEKGEGTDDWMYLDVNGLVTVGPGILLKVESDVNKVKWVREGGGPASPDEARPRWRELYALGAPIRAKTEQAKPAGAYKDPGGVRLSMAGLLNTRVRGKYVALKAWPEFRNFDDFPPDAQAAILVRSWGPFDNIHCPKFIAACGKRDWEAARREITYRASQVDANRNPTMQRMMENAVGEEYERNALGKVYPVAPVFPGRMVSAAGKAAKKALLSPSLSANNWSEVYRLLNGLSMREMLATLDEASLDDLRGIARNLSVFGGPFFPARIRFALDVIKNRSVPANAPGDVIRTGQDKVAEEYLQQYKGHPKPIEF
jgi:hypothetical protein